MYSKCWEYEGIQCGQKARYMGEGEVAEEGSKCMFVKGPRCHSKK